MKKRILIVEDEIIIAREIEAQLKFLGYEIIGTAVSASEALSIVNEKKPDLILMDIVIRGELDGIDVGLQVQKKHHIPIIYVTAYTDEETISRAKVTQPFGFIKKPFTQRELYINIEIALYRHAIEDKIRGIEFWFSRSLLNNLEPAISVDLKGNILSLNDPAKEILELTEEESVGRNLFDVVKIFDKTGEKSITALSSMHNALGPCFSENLVEVKKTQKSIFVEDIVFFTRNADNDPNGYILVFRPQALIVIQTC